MKAWIKKINDLEAEKRDNENQAATLNNKMNLYTKKIEGL